MGTTINILPPLRDRLKTYGHSGETYNDILKRLMDNMDRDAFLRKAREVREHPERFEWVDLEEL